MASIALKHATGNSTSLHSPAANPSANITLKVPSTTGTAGQVLKVASANHSSTNAELEWAADAAGKILKVEGTLIQTSFSTTTTNAWVATGIKDSITPSAASSKIIVLINSHDLWKDSTTHAVITVGVKVAGGSASYLGNATNGLGYITGGQSGATSVSVLHTPSYSLGEAIEYEMYGKAAGGGTLYMGNGNANIGIVLMEVAA